MAYCKTCGNYIDDNTTICTQCGSQQIPGAVNDQGGFGWGLLGCCIPLVGLILFLIWKDTKPKTAKAAGKGALVSVLISVGLYIILFVVGIAAGFANM